MTKLVLALISIHYARSLTVEFREIVDKMGVKDFFLKKILFVQKQNDRRVLEPRIGDDGAEQRLALVHAVLKEQVRIHEISRSPARLCPPTKALPTDRQTSGPTDQRIDGPTDGHTLL